LAITANKAILLGLSGLPHFCIF